MATLIKFDWAIKRLLRNPASFGILEGFLSELLMEDIKINSILESESNQENKYDKFNVVDILVQNSKGELIIIEIQNDREADYLQRMLYGTSKLLVSNMSLGMEYKAVRKIISVNIVYFDLGHGEDYIYHGTTNFIGLNKHDVLKLQKKEQNLYKTEKVHKVFPEYYIIKVVQFDNIAKNTLDEWIYFLKNEEIKEGYSAKGLRQAKDELSIMKLSEKERKEYDHWMAQRRYEHSMIVSNREENLWEGEDKGRREKAIEIAKKCFIKGMKIHEISELTGLAEEDIKKLR